MKRLRALSLFANIGVAEALFEQAGVEVVLANEVDKRRADLYRSIYPKTEMICGDITCEDTQKELLKLAKTLRVNLVLATPPCQGMSIAGTRDPRDQRNQLIFYALKIIKILRPDFVLLENVQRQLKTKILLENIEMLIPEYIERELGSEYSFNDIKVLNTVDYGVPQSRQRNIYLASKKNQPHRWEAPPPDNKIITLERSIGNLPSVDPLLSEGLEMTKTKYPHFHETAEIAAQVSKWHKPPRHPWRHVEWMIHTPTGKSAIFNPEHYPRNKDGSPIHGHHNHYRRLKWDSPCRTVTMFNAYISTLCSVHPGRPIESDLFGSIYSDARALTIFELMIVMSIPSDWNIPAELNESFFRSVIGEGIPPLLALRLIQQLPI